MDAETAATKIQQGLGSLANVDSSTVQAVSKDGKVEMTGSVGSLQELNLIKEMVEESVGVDASMVDYRIVME